MIDMKEGKEEYSDYDLQRDVVFIKDKLGRLDSIMFGTRETAIPSGIVYEVNKNSEFRQNIVKWFWVVGTQLTIIILFLAYNFLHGGF